MPTDAARQARLLREVATAGDTITEILGIACARNDRGELLTEAQTGSIREAILQWHNLKSSALAALT